ncbi:MAG: hypothetical protein RL607_923 [Bacteroidota bacterium]|jgi:hypothetical protein
MRKFKIMKKTLSTLVSSLIAAVLILIRLNLLGS